MPWRLSPLHLCESLLPWVSVSLFPEVRVEDQCLFLGYQLKNVRIIEQFGLEETFKGHLVQTPVQWAGTSSTRWSCSEPCQIWPWILPEMGHLPHL